MHLPDESARSTSPPNSDDPPGMLVSANVSLFIRSDVLVCMNSALKKQINSYTKIKVRRRGKKRKKKPDKHQFVD